MGVCMEYRRFNNWQNGFFWYAGHIFNHLHFNFAFVSVSVSVSLDLHCVSSVCLSLSPCFSPSLVFLSFFVSVSLSLGLCLTLVTFLSLYIYVLFIYLNIYLSIYLLSLFCFIANHVLLPCRKIPISSFVWRRPPILLLMTMCQQEHILRLYEGRQIWM